MDETENKSKVRNAIVDTDAIETKYRKISVETLAKFNVGYRDGIVYPLYSYKGVLLSQRIRKKNKQFPLLGQPLENVGFFGSHLFPKGSSKNITITEGENDAMAVYQMMGHWPVVSLKSGAGTARKLTEDDYEYLNSFSEIRVCFDNDEQGKKATENFCSLFPTKVKIINFPQNVKDAHQMLEEGRQDEFKKLWWNPSGWSPANIVYPEHIQDEVINPRKIEAIEYPWIGLNDKIFGLHKPEVILITGATKSGKSIITGDIIRHILETTDEKIADISVESTPVERARQLLALHMGKPLHLGLVDETKRISTEEQTKAYNEFFKTNRIYFFDKFGNSDVDELLAKIDYYVDILGCTTVLMDHINFATSFHESDERQTLDIFTNKLAKKAVEKNITIIMIAHENDSGQVFGSRNAAKVCFTHLRIVRDKKHKVPEMRQITELGVELNRRYGRDGFKIYLKFNEDGYGFTEISEEEVEIIRGDDKNNQ